MMDHHPAAMEKNMTNSRYERMPVTETGTEKKTERGV